MRIGMLFLLSLLFAGCKSTRTVEIVSVDYVSSEGELTFHTAVANDSGKDEIFFWETKQYCPQLNPALFNITRNEYVKLWHGALSSHRFSSISRLPNGCSVTVKSVLGVSEEGLQPGDYRLTVTHPLDPDKIASCTFSVPEPWQNPDAPTKPGDVPLPGSGPLQTNAMLTEDQRTKSPGRYALCELDFLVMQHMDEREGRTGLLSRTIDPWLNEP